MQPGGEARADWARVRSVTARRQLASMVGSLLEWIWRE